MKERSSNIECTIIGGNQLTFLEESIVPGHLSKDIAEYRQRRPRRGEHKNDRFVTPASVNNLPPTGLPLGCIVCVVISTPSAIAGP